MKNPEENELMNTKLFPLNILAFGAVGDGTTKDTASIQAAINRCGDSGGGIVLVPPGIYLTGTLWLKDNVELHISRGAEIKGSPDLADYNVTTAFDQNRECAAEEVTGAHLIIAHERKNIAITGYGIINGNSDAFFDKSVKNGRLWKIKNKRPAQMVYFCECENVVVENISLLDSTYWNLFLYGCEDVKVTGVRIYNAFATRNGDGIDIDCCRNVVVSDCNIHSGDDGITVRGDSTNILGGKLKLRHEKEKDATQTILYEGWPIKEDRIKRSENVCVNNCVITSACIGIRIGVGDGEVRNCAFSNIVINNSRWGIVLTSKWLDFGDTGTNIENIRFSNIIIEACQPFGIAGGAGARASISNIFFDNISASGKCASFISGEPEWRIRNLHFTNVDLSFSGGEGNIADENDLSRTAEERDAWRPAAFFCRNVNGLFLNQVRIHWHNLTAPFRHDIMLEDVTGTINGFNSNSDQLGFKQSITQNADAKVTIVD